MIDGDDSLTITCPACGGPLRLPVAISYEQPEERADNGDRVYVRVRVGLDEERMEEAVNAHLGDDLWLHRGWTEETS